MNNEKNTHDCCGTDAPKPEETAADCGCGTDAPKPEQTAAKGSTFEKHFDCIAMMHKFCGTDKGHFDSIALMQKFCGTEKGHFDSIALMQKFCDTLKQESAPEKSDSKKHSSCC